VNHQVIEAVIVKHIFCCFKGSSRERSLIGNHYPALK